MRVGPPDSRPHLGQFKPGTGHELVDGPVEVAAPEDTALQRCEPVLEAGHLLLGCQAVLQEVQGAARTQHPLNGRGDRKADSSPLAIRVAPEDSGRRIPEADRPCSLAESTDVHRR